MWIRSLFAVSICASFFLGVYGAGNLMAGGPWQTYCVSGTALQCPPWQCSYTTAGGANATCSTCGFPDPLGVNAGCTPDNCSWCKKLAFSICCSRWNTCSGKDFNTGADCLCGVANYPGNNDVSSFCLRKPSIWTLFASR